MKNFAVLEYVVVIYKSIFFSGAIMEANQYGYISSAMNKSKRDRNQLTNPIRFFKAKVKAFLLYNYQN